MVLERNFVVEEAYRAFYAGDILQAEAACVRLLEARKNDVQALWLLGLVAHRKGDLPNAINYFKRCVSLQPKDPALPHTLAQALMEHGSYDEALVMLDRATQLNPKDQRPIADRADIFERQGKRDAAWALLRPYLESGTETAGMAVVLMRLMKHERRNQDAIDLARRHLARQRIDTTSRSLLLRLMARLYEEAGDHGRSFEAFSAAIRASAVPFDPDEHAESFDRLMATFSAENLARLPRASNTSELPIFIACMPRSGSTLVEQIIHAHPRAFGAGEIPHLNDLVTNLQTLIESFQMYPACIGDLRQQHVDQLGQQYLSDIAKMAPTAIRITNKSLRNYLHLGMIALLFPKARVVHIRRDPLDNGFACYMAALQPDQYPWVSDLRNIGLAWRQYERLMDHWRDVLDIPMLEVVYEELVDDTENQIRRLIDFCGLEWDDRCLRYWEAERNVMTLSYDQVRKPIFKTAVKRYEKYEAFLGPLKEALAEADDGAE